MNPQAKRNAHSTPRAVGGGRSPRYAKRRAARPASMQYAPEWSDAAAAAVLKALQMAGDRKVRASALRVLESPRELEAFVAHLPLTADGRGLAARIMREHAARVQAAPDEAEALMRVHTFLKPLRDRKAARTEAEPLVLAPAPPGPQTFHAWLSARPAKDKHRCIRKSTRILEGVGSWPLGWMKKTGAICFERAEGRVRKERSGRPDGAFLRGVVKFDELLTATANPSDHYVILTPSKEPRFMTVQETMRAFGVPAQSLLWNSLSRPSGLLTATQAVSCMGRGIHVGVARQVVATLVADGAIGPGLAYGSAFSGIDLFAAAVEAELSGQWSYEFASESDPVPRKGLLEAWKKRGLTAENCYASALAGEAKGARTVGLYMTSPECQAFSRRNHDPKAKDQRVSLEEFWESLAYVRASRPRVVVVENVAEHSSVGPITGLLARLEGYTVATGALDPRRTANMPICRERQYWVLKTKS